MKDPSRHIQKILVEEDCLDHPRTRRILQAAAGVRQKTVPAGWSLGQRAEDHVGELSAGKRELLLCRNRGRFFKPCPATREYRCCHYQVLNIGMNCPMDCVYCILQAYLNNPFLSFFVNTEELFSELEEAFTAEPERLWRIGTGEFTDSLALDRLTGLSRELVPFMAGQQRAVLELKTKSAVVDNLEGLRHNGRTIVSWSLNATDILAREELRTATLEERLEAAGRTAGWGYRLAFHFDPIILHTGWEEGYRRTVKALFAAVPASSIAWISMGCLRYLPPLKTIASRRFPNSRFFYEEAVEGLDGKARYFRAQRVRMYRFLFDLLASRMDGSTCLYLCMESDAIWREVFGFTPEERGGVPAMLDRSVFGIG